MLDPLLQLGTSFTLGLATPLSAVCVLPLYPAFLAYLARKGDGRSARLLGAVVAAGVLAFMLTVGLLVTTLLQRSLTGVVETVSPAAFALIGAVGLLLLLDIDLSTVLPELDEPRFRNPWLEAFGFGFFFGAIVIPCNPGFIAAFFARSLLLQSPAANVAHVTAFGLGIAAPLLAFAVLPQQYSSRTIALLNRRQSLINRGAGTIMVLVAVYYLGCVFGIVSIGPLCDLTKTFAHAFSP